MPVKTRIEPARQRSTPSTYRPCRNQMGAWLLLLLALGSAPPALAGQVLSPDLGRLEDGFSLIYRTVSPSVVEVLSETLPGDSTAQGTHGSAAPGTNRGSGFVFASSPAGDDRQFILTSHHVIDQARRVTVRLADGREFNANITGSDAKTDVAIIDIVAPGLKPLPLGDSDAVQIGHWVLAVGNPFGLRQSLSVGVVSGTGRTNIGINNYEDYIQTDAAVSPGNSGGPLVNLRGETVGMISAVLTDNGGPAGAGFAIPINLVRPVADQLVAQGRVDRAYLGVFLQSLTGPLARAFGVDDTSGALITEVAPGSPADVAGLRVGDLIVRYRGKPVRDAGSFINDLSLTVPESEVAIDIVRNARPETLTVTVAARRAHEPIAAISSPTPAVRLLGMTVSPVTQTLATQFGVSSRRAEAGDSLIITAVEQGSAAARSGLEPGSIILQINRQSVGNLAEFSHLMQAGSPANQTLLLVRQGNAQNFFVLGR